MQPTKKLSTQRHYVVYVIFYARFFRQSLRFRIYSLNLREVFSR